MEGLILHYRRGRRTQSTHQMLVHVDGVESREKARSLLQKKVVWKSPAGKAIAGEITNLHGNKGAVRVQFEKGLPGQSIGEKVEIQ